MDMKAKRLALTEAILADWRGHNIDVIIAPGFAMPAVKLSYPAWLLGGITYTSASRTRRPTTSSTFPPVLFR
jgi:hypothetical protein